MPRAVSHRDTFDHWNLEVYRVAVTFFGDAYRFAERFRRDDAFIRWQLLRAALSIQLNIGEGYEESSPLEKARLYRLARRSAGECAAVLDAVIEALRYDPVELEPMYKTIRRIMAMLLELIRKMERNAGKTSRRAASGRRWVNEKKTNPIRSPKPETESG